jgi:hypothetical protein
MAEGSRVRVKSDGDRKQLEVVLSKSELKALGSLSGRDNVDTLKRLSGSLPDILSVEARKQLPAGRSLGRLFTLLDGTAKKGARNAGSSVEVVVMDASGGEVYRAVPKEPKLVADLRARVGVIKGSIRHDHELAGVPEPETTKLYNQLDHAFEAYKQVFELSRSGLGMGEIARKTGSDPYTANSWLTGTHIPIAISRIDPASRPGTVSPVDIPRGESADFAYLLGVYAAVSEASGKTDKFVINHTEAAVARKVARAFKDAFKKDAATRKRTIKDTAYHQVSFYSKLLTDHISNVTQGNTRLPWEHLVNREERLAFLQGFLAFTGSVTYRKQESKSGTIKSPIVHVEKRRNPGLVRDVAVLLTDFGIAPTLRNDKLRIEDKGSLEILRQEGILTSKKMSNKLDGLLGQPPTQKDNTPEKYYEVRKYADEHGNAGVAEIAQATGVSWMCTRDWSRGLKKPPSVKRLEEMEKIENELPSKDVIGYVYRLGASSMLARDIAGRHKDVNKVKERCATLEQGGVKGAELERQLTEMFGKAGEQAKAAEQRPPYADRLDALVGKWEEFNDPLRMMDISAGLIASRHKAKGATAAKVRAYLLDAVKNKRPGDYDTLATYLETPEGSGR